MKEKLEVAYLKDTISAYALGSGENKELQSLTVRLIFLTHSVRMRPNFEGLPWL